LRSAAAASPLLAARPVAPGHRVHHPGGGSAHGVQLSAPSAAFGAGNWASVFLSFGMGIGKACAPAAGHSLRRYPAYYLVGPRDGPLLLLHEVWCVCHPAILHSCP